MTDTAGLPIPIMISQKCRECTGGAEKLPRDSEGTLAFMRERIHKCWGCEWFADLYIPPMLRILEEVWNQQDSEGGYSTRVRQLREQMGLRQGQFAERLGVRREQVVRWENGRSRPGKGAKKKLEALREELGD